MSDPAAAMEWNLNSFEETFCSVCVITVIFMAVSQIKQTVLRKFFFFNDELLLPLPMPIIHLFFLSLRSLSFTCSKYDFVFIKHKRCVCMCVCVESIEQMVIWKSAVIFVQLITQVHNLFLNDFERIFQNQFKRNYIFGNFFSLFWVSS